MARQTFSWYVDLNQMRERASLLDRYADESNDSHDHDELHAAAEVLRTYASRGIIPGDYVRRWIEGIV